MTKFRQLLRLLTPTTARYPWITPAPRSTIRFSSNDTGVGTMGSNDYDSLEYTVRDKVAHIQLNRPDRLNAIDAAMPFELQRAVDVANLDDNVKVILLSGKGGNFCSGYDLKQFAEKDAGNHPCVQKGPWDPYVDFKFMSRSTECFMSLWKSLKPTVCKINGVAIGGGSDIALCCDITVMADDARIGYPPARVWGCPTTAMWVYRVGMEQAKRILFTGQIITGEEAAKMGLVGESAPPDKLDATVDRIIKRIVNVPTNQLFFQKQMINQAMEQMGLFQTQRLATLFDGMARHSPEGAMFKERCSDVGFKQAVKERDSGEETVWSSMTKSKL